MDQKLLDALNNLSNALQLISDALIDKKGAKAPTAQTLQSGDFSKQIVQINAGIKSIKKDTQDILKQQKTILSMSNKDGNNKAGGGKTGIFEEAGDKKSESNLKKGVGAIILIAIGVLAVGMAFKIIGKVDFLSVVALGLAIVLISVAFEKVAKLDIPVKKVIDTSKNLVIISIAIMLSSWALKFIAPVSFAQAITAILIAGMFTVVSYGLSKMITALGGAKLGSLTKSIIFLPMILPAIALGITISSWILTKVTPISFAQGITAILIAGVFTVVSFGISKMITALGGAGLGATMKSIMFLPLLLPAIALGIAASSWVLKMVSPISFGQAITAILIAVVFTVISFGLKKLISSFQGIDPGALLAASIMIPILLPVLAFSIAVSSWALSTVKPISFAQFLTSLAISLLFIVVSYAVSIILKTTKEIKMGDVVKIPLLFVTMSIAIYLSSIILSKTEKIDNDKLWSILKLGVVLAIVSIVLSAAFWVIKKLGVGLTDVIKGSLIIVVLATTIMLSSLILSVGKYDSYPSLDWALGVGASTLAFGISAIALGLVLMTGVGAIAIGLGAAAILGVAVTIVATAEILSKGNFSKYPSLDWAVGVGLLITSFGLSTLALGGFILGTLGLGGLALKKGGEAVLNIAQSIVDTSAILKKGDFTGGPTKAWAEGISLALGAFAPIYAMLMADGIMKIFGGGGIGPEDFSKAIVTISTGIVDSAKFFNGTTFTGGPTKAWAEGVSLALGAFAPIYAMLMADGIMKIFGGGISPEDFSGAIKIISEGISYSAKLFVGTEGMFKGGPTKSWADGVGTAISAFAPVFKILMADGVLKIFGSGIDPASMKSAIMTISQGIVDAAMFFKGKGDIFSDGSYPSEAWGKNVGLALAAFAPVYEAISGKGFFQSSESAVSKLTEGVKSMAGAIVSVAMSFSDPNVSWSSYPTKEWADGVAGSVGSYIGISEYLADKKYDDSVVSIARKLSNVAQIMGKAQFVSKIDPNFMKNMQSNIFYYIELTKKLNESSGGLKGLLKGVLLGDPITNVANSMIRLANAYDKMAGSLKRFGASLGSIDANKIETFKNLNSGILNKSGGSLFSNVVSTAGNVIDSVTSGIGSVFSGIFGGLFGGKSEETKTQIVSAPAKVGKYGDSAQQLDQVIDLLTRLTESTKSLDIYIKEQQSKNGGKSATAEK